MMLGKLADKNQMKLSIETTGNEGWQDIPLGSMLVNH
jgi:hypothetical protein